MFDKDKKKVCYFLYILIILAVAIRIFYVFEIPLGQTVKMKLEGLNDEPSHFNYVKYLAKYKSFPVQKMSVQTDSAFIKNEFEYYQPPLYYLLCSPFAMLFKSETALLLSRVISLFFGLLSVYLIYKLLIFIGFSKMIGLFSVTLTLYLLSPSYFSSLCSNDSLSWFFPILLLYQLYKVDKQEIVLKELILISLTLALALLTKSSNMILLLFTFGVSLYQFVHGRKRNASILIAATMIGALVAFPWYLRNYYLYNSFLAMEVGFGPIHESTLPFGYHLYLMVRGAIGYFWFPMQHVPQSLLRRILTASGILIVVVQMGAYFFWSIKNHRVYNLFNVHLLLVLSVLAYVSLQLKWDNPEGRYLFTALFPIILILLAPIQQILNSKRMIWSLLVLLFLSFFSYLYFLLI